jgi:4-hydroxy-4-methyl-2-oxoglutarate aldolase
MNDVVARLGALDACAVSDALDSLQLPGVAYGLVRLSTDRRIAGRVTTVELVPADGAASPRHLGTAAIDASGPGQVIVVAHAGRVEVSGWGGILSLAARARDIEGVIVDGACRDIDESRELNLPIFARGSVPATARGRIIEKDWNVPVRICGIEVRPDDYVIADGSGVVFIPGLRAAEIIAKAEQIANRERAIAEQVRKGTPVSEAMGATYESLLARPK